MPGITRVGLDPISRGPLQLRRRGHHTLDPRIDQVTSQPKAGRARLIDHHCRPRQRPDPVTNFFAARCQPPLKNLTGFSVQSTPDHRSCVHIQPDTRTMTFHWGLLHLWLYQPGPDSCRQPTFTCSEAPASSYRLATFGRQSRFASASTGTTAGVCGKPRPGCFTFCSTCVYRLIHSCATKIIAAGRTAVPLPP